jgi:hypothetical protein
LLVRNIVNLKKIYIFSIERIRNTIKVVVKFGLHKNKVSYGTALHKAQTYDFKFRKN